MKKLLVVLLTLSLLVVFTAPALAKKGGDKGGKNEIKFDKLEIKDSGNAWTEIYVSAGDSASTGDAMAVGGDTKVEIEGKVEAKVEGGKKGGKDGGGKAENKVDIKVTNTQTNTAISGDATVNHTGDNKAEVKDTVNEAILTIVIGIGGM